MVDGAPRTERVLRLANGFPTTARENTAFEARAARNREAMNAFLASSVHITPATTAPRDDAAVLEDASILGLTEGGGCVCVCVCVCVCASTLSRVCVCARVSVSVSGVCICVISRHATPCVLACLGLRTTPRHSRHCPIA